MSENPGSSLWYGAQNMDLDIDAVPDGSLPDDGQSAGCCQTEPSGTTCSGENSGSNPMNQQDGISTGNEANLSAACQNDQTTKRPDESSNFGSVNSWPQKPEFARQQSSQTEDTDDHEKSLSDQIFLPSHLRQQHFDILVIHAEEDMPAAENLKKTIEELYAKSIDGERIPITVGLTGEVALHIRSIVHWLGAAMTCCTYIFVIFTEHLRNDDDISEMGDAALYASFSGKWKNKFCPVYLEKGAKQALKLSAHINVRSSVDMWKDPSNFKALIVKYIDVAPRIARCLQQDQEAKEYCEKLRDTVAHSTSAETTDCSRKFHKNEISSARNSQQPHFPVLSTISSVTSDSGFSGETASTPGTDLASNNSSEHSSPADFKSCPVKPEPCEENSLPNDMSTEQSSAVLKLHEELVEKCSPQTSTDWQSYYLPMTICAVSVIGAGLVGLYLLRR